MNFSKLPRADVYTIKNTHQIYRKYRIPGVRRSKYYQASGVDETYNLSPTDKEMPTETEAIPALRTVKIGNGHTKDLMRKEVNHKTQTCPDCDTSGRVIEKTGERFCPDCGMLLGRKNIERTVNAARQIND